MQSHMINGNIELNVFLTTAGQIWRNTSCTYFVIKKEKYAERIAIKFENSNYSTGQKKEILF